MEYELLVGRVKSYLEFMVLNGKSNMTFSELEEKFGIPPYAQHGNRAKKIWKKFEKSGYTDVDEYLRKTQLCPKDSKFCNLNITHSTSPSKPIDYNVSSDTIGNTLPPDERKFTVTESEAVFTGRTYKSIRTLDEALEFAKVDLNLWEVTSYQFTSWDVSMKIEEIKVINDVEVKVLTPTTLTNYGCVVKFAPKSTTADEIYQRLIDDAIKCVPNFNQLPVVPVLNPTSIGVLNIADLHIGAEVSNLIRTPDYNIEILISHLDRIVNTINSHGYGQVHVNMVGDYFESISGLNHLNTFKSLGRGMYGSRVIILAATIIGNMLSKINNLTNVNLISGNHDRLTPQSDIDNEGGAAELLSHILSLKLSGVKFTYHTYLLNPVIDGMCYILTHGNFKIDKKDIGKIVTLYGDNTMYNLWLSGHVHTRQTEKTTIRRTLEFSTYVAVSSDEASYRKIVLPPVFTGNFYSETLGYTSTGGCVITENNGNGKPNVYDYSL